MLLFFACAECDNTDIDLLFTTLFCANTATELTDNVLLSPNIFKESLFKVLSEPSTLIELLTVLFLPDIDSAPDNTEFSVYKSKVFFCAILFLL